MVSYIGMVSVIACLVAGILILGGDVMNFIDPASIMLTIVPTVGALVASYPLELLSQVPGHLKAMTQKPYDPEDHVGTLVEISKLARAEGILAIEQKLDTYGDKFLQYGMRLVVDGADEIYVKNSLTSYLMGLDARHNEAIAIYERGASYAPAFGMCATVISLVNMLMSLDFSDPNAILSLGANMATALITTFYGSVIANVFFTPVASKLKMLHKREVFCKTMIADGILGIQQGDNPAKLEAMLMEQIRPKNKKGDGGGAKKEEGSAA